MSMVKSHIYQNAEKYESHEIKLQNTTVSS